MVGMDGSINPLVSKVAEILGKSYNEVAHNMNMVDMIAELVKQVEKREKMLQLFIVDKG